MERITRINDTKQELARCSSDELIAMRGYVEARLAQAQADLAKIDNELISRHDHGQLDDETV